MLFCRRTAVEWRERQPKKLCSLDLAPLKEVAVADYHEQLSGCYPKVDGDGDDDGCAAAN